MEITLLHRISWYITLLPGPNLFSFIFKYSLDKLHIFNTLFLSMPWLSGIRFSFFSLDTLYLTHHHLSKYFHSSSTSINTTSLRLSVHKTQHGQFPYYASFKVKKLRLSWFKQLGYPKTGILSGMIDSLSLCLPKPVSLTLILCVSPVF